MFPGTAIESGEKPPLTAELCLDIVVRNAPIPNNYDPAIGTDQLLGALGVNGPTETTYHQEGIRADLQRIQYQIALTDITSGSGVTVGACLQSVHDNAV